MSKLILFFITALFYSFNSFAACMYSINEESAKLTWTGYKFTNKTGVSGTFKDISFTQKESTSLKGLLESVKFKIKTESLDSGNPARDITLKTAVFNLLKVPGVISGEIIEYGEEISKVKLVLNEEALVSFKTSITNMSLTSKGSIDLMNNGLKSNYEAVHNSCEKLHTGEDGVSKTWSTVDLKIEAEIIKSSCSIIDKIKGLMFNY